MRSSAFKQVSKSVQKDVRNLSFLKVAKEVSSDLRVAGEERDDDWHRVNGYAADILKDSSMMYSKLARLQNDFEGQELEALEKISEGVLDLGSKMSGFARKFFKGEFRMKGQQAYPGGPMEPPPSPPPDAVPPPVFGEEVPEEPTEEPVPTFDEEVPEETEEKTEEEKTEE